MIPIEKQVCSLYWSKELVNRGIKIDSVWWWIVRDDEKPRLELYNTGFSKGYDTIPAPTVVELAALLPPQYSIKKFGVGDESRYFCRGKYDPPDFVSPVLANVVAQKYVY